MGVRLNHEIPEWVNRDATYLVTIGALDRRVNTFCHPEIGQIVLDSIRLPPWYKVMS